MASVLAVGERFNQKGWTPCPDDDLSFKLRVNMGLYNFGRGRTFLNRMGVKWTHGINLLWPSPIAGEWDAAEARRVVDAIRKDVERYDVVLLFGRRVCDAFDVAFNVGERSGRYIPLPHPSGRNRMWNDPRVRETVRLIMETLR